VFLNEVDISGIRDYMKALLISVKHLADHGIMHRDIKPSNFLYDPKQRTGLLIDFGLSELEIGPDYKPKINGDDETVKKIAKL